MARARYRFRKIRPGAYARRAPHIYVTVKVHGRERLLARMYFADAAQNATDTILAAIADPAQRRAVIVAIDPRTKSGVFDIAMAPAR